jgi:hypothetical protein
MAGAIERLAAGMTWSALADAILAAVAGENGRSRERMGRAPADMAVR